MEDPLIELQTRIAFQEDALYELTKTVMSQQLEIAELKKDRDELKSQLRSLSLQEPVEAIDEQPPPHY
ncbi:MAG: SlyX family protein [Gammaproteobacteria bacterium]|nr:SlyX family protein [Gammaproteobacteria bacterium]